MLDVPGLSANARAARQPPASGSSAIDPLQLPFCFRDRTLCVLCAGAVVGKHVNDDEVGDCGCRLLATVPMPDAGRVPLDACANTAFFGSAVQTGAVS